MCSGHSLSDLWVPSVACIELEPQLGTALPGNMTGLGARGNLASSWNVQILSAAISHKTAICHKTATGRRAGWSLAMVGSPSFRLWQVQVLRFKALKVWYFFFYQWDGSDVVRQMLFLMFLLLFRNRDVLQTQFLHPVVLLLLQWVSKHELPV